jgi:hypothetical protein
MSERDEEEEEGTISESNNDSPYLKSHIKFGDE